MGEVGVGSRTLSVFLQKGNYHFSTYNGGNHGIAVNAKHPVDYEGLWTFIYQSYSLNDKNCIFFIKFGDEKLIKGVMAAEHTTPAYLKFYIGGNDSGDYTGFNG